MKKYRLSTAEGLKTDEERRRPPRARARSLPQSLAQGHL